MQLKELKKMTIIPDPNKPLMISRAFMEDQNVSFRCKGFLTLLLDQQGDITKFLNDTSDEEVDLMLEQLRENGYAIFDEKINDYIYTDKKQ